jgi:hypothetical protein
MDEEYSQLKHREREQRAAEGEQSQQATSVEFGSVEEALRVDRERTELPPHLAERVSDTIRREPTRPASWWSRWFRKG